MVDKLHEYEGWVGRFHTWRDSLKSKYSTWKPPEQFQYLKEKLSGRPRPPKAHTEDTPQEDYSHVYRKKTRSELIRISAAVMGIEFSYAAETAFVSPTLLKIGVEHQNMTLVWALSPLVGFFLTPLLGSLSDRCRMKFGRRRPFIFLLSIGVLLGLLLVPNGEDLGYAMGDEYSHIIENNTKLALPILPHRTTVNNINTTQSEDYVAPNSHPWGVFFTVLGTVLLDFDADSCQSPARAYLLDVTLPDDHARGLSTFTVMAGLGGFFGYGLGGINWDATAIGVLFGGHVRAVFSLITIIFVVCVSFTMTSFREIPMDVLEDDKYVREVITVSNAKSESSAIASEPEKSYGAVVVNSEVHDQRRLSHTNPFVDMEGDPDEISDQRHIEDCTKMNSECQMPKIEHEHVSLKHYLLSIIIMPYSLRIVCLTNLFCWSAHVCYSLYFTDFVGEAVFGGNPAAPEGSVSRELYEEGVRFGCWGMSLYSLSCAMYSLVIERLIERFGAKKVYVGGLFTYGLGMMLMALTKHKVGVIFFSWTAGVMYSTLFTMPYLLVAHYHAHSIFEITPEGEARFGTQLRGLGTDVAIVSSMVFLAQFGLSVCMGSIVSYLQTTTAVVGVASLLSFLGAISATQVMYLDL